MSVISSHEGEVHGGREVTIVVTMISVTYRCDTWVPYPGVTQVSQADRPDSVVELHSPASTQRITQCQQPIYYLHRFSLNLLLLKHGKQGQIWM
jgi:hypothetical protein